METKNTMKGSIIALKIGGEVIFPIEKVESIRVYASNVGAVYGRKFKTNVNRKNGTVTVKRIS